MMRKKESGGGRRSVTVPSQCFRPRSQRWATAELGSHGLGLSIVAERSAGKPLNDPVSGGGVGGQADTKSM